MSEPVTVYTSSYCLHSRRVVRFLKKNDIPAEIINIDGDPEARQKVMAINNGYASVPTVIFPRRDAANRAILQELREKLNIETSLLTTEGYSKIGGVFLSDHAGFSGRSIAKRWALLFSATVRQYPRCLRARDL